MKSAIISDIHGNLEALEAVLREIAKESPDEIICLGDVVGYGADPQACLDRIRELGVRIIGGNHDFAVSGRLDSSNFNDHAKAAVEWTAANLDAESLDFLSSLPLVLEGEDFVAVHATLNSPESFDYIQTMEQAAALLDKQPVSICVSGHTHVPLAFIRSNGETGLIWSTNVVLEGDERALVNVGSIGQPRDEDPRASFAMLEANRRHIRTIRVEYDIDEAARKIHLAGLPPVLAERLRFGY